ncbi:RICIN domain-containing protein [Ruminococcus sp.]|uniref:RICIN domain-containing protein n=1 Tax=Ruminococcus sp. TaxID=41978 RepID=UPI0025D727F7|nr:RICIN domain-containing protein [Ruminococcus sp.]
MNIKKLLSGLLATTACITSLSFTTMTNLNAKAEAGRNISDGIYYIRNLNSGKYIDVKEARTANGTEIIQYDFTGGKNQQFRITRESDGYYTIKPVHYEAASLDFQNSYMANTNGTDAQLYHYYSNSTEQRFTIENAIGGGFQIGTKSSKGKKVLEVTNSSKSNNAIIQIWDYSNTRMNDNWAFERVSDRGASYMVLTQPSAESQKSLNSIVSSLHNLGYDTYGYNPESPTSLNSRTSMLNCISTSNIVAIQGNGTPGCIQVDKDVEQTLDSNEFLQINPEFAWKHVSLVYFACSSSATGTVYLKSLAQTAYDAGATCVIGFNYSVSGAEKFFKYMMDAVEANPNTTVREAVNYAREKYTMGILSNSSLPSDSPARIENLHIFGNPDVTLNLK